MFPSFDPENVLSRIAVIDVEATGLHAGSFPIEIGWYLPDRDASGSVLVCPPDHAIAERDCDADAIHGITPDVLRAEGYCPEAAAATLVDGLKGRDHVYSDAPHADIFWLELLFEAARRRDFRRKPHGGAVGPGFRLHDVDSLLKEAGTTAILAYVDAPDAGDGPHHRAATDATRIGRNLAHALRRAGG